MNHAQLPHEGIETVPKPALNWAVAAHLSGLLLYLGVPFGNLLGPLLIWLFKRSESPFTEAQAKEALNFQISITLYGLVAGFFVVVLVGVFLLPIIFFVQLMLTIIAAVRVSSGQAYTYPLTIRLIA